MSAVPRIVRDSTSAGAGSAPESVAPADVHDSARLPRTRAGTAWVLACGAAVALLALIVFITQNLHLVDVSFLGWHGQFPLVVALLAGALIGSVLTLILGSTRILQLRRTAARSRRERAQARVVPDRKSGSERSAP
jgi:lipopolysaccharide assembly protein A